MTKPLSRRHFLQAAGVGGAVWVPTPVKGYSASEITRHASVIGGEVSELGVSVWDLDTPALVVDLDALEEVADGVVEPLLPGGGRIYMMGPAGRFIPA